MFKFLIILLLSSVSIKASTDGKCRALALEGGGDRGAYHAGAMAKMYELLPKEEFQYDTCAGISAGSLNCAAWGLFPKGMEEQSVAFITNTWNTITRKQVYKEWSMFPIAGLLDGLIFQPGLFDNSPLKQYLTNIMGDYALVRNISVGATDISNAKYQRFWTHDLKSKEDIVHAVISSSAIEMMFPHEDWNNTAYGDGGLMHMIDMEAGIEHCLNQGYAQEDIILDAIFCVGWNATVYDSSQLTTMGMAIRTLDIFASRFFNEDFNNAMSKYPNVDYRYMIIPPMLLDLDAFMTFIPLQMKAMQKSGAKEAEKVIKSGPNFKKVMNAIKENPGNLQEVLKVYQSY